MVLRWSSLEQTCLYADHLLNNNIRLIEKPTLETACRAVHDGCRVGLMIIREEQDLQRMDTYEKFMNINEIAWVGLFSEELISLPSIRKFISERLFNFLTVPANLEHLVLVLRHAWGMAFVHDAHKLSTDAISASRLNATMIGKTVQMQRLARQIRKVASTDAAVLISGPSGTGKELAALSIHRQSSRKDAPFVAVNCGAIPATLFQSELFGYEKGAFTGANQRKIGRIEAAQGGTLFLDEIGDMPFDMQVNMLRFLQEKTIERVGGTASQAMDVRVIAATHIDLEEAVKCGHFREDLYYRINVICITTPRLVECTEDIEHLALHYFRQFAQAHNKSLRGFSRDAMKAMLQHDWPGNVRELVNRIQRAVVMAEGRFIKPEDLGFRASDMPEDQISLERARAAAERETIQRALVQARHQISRAAKLLGISRVTLYRLLEKYQIRNGIAAQEGDLAMDPAPQKNRIQPPLNAASYSGNVAFTDTKKL
ncbi:MAG: sigma-54 dependent transcriptional regulator [Oxalobacteraceae bacterium]